MDPILSKDVTNSSSGVDEVVLETKETATHVEIRSDGPKIPTLEDYVVREDNEVTSSDEENSDNHDSSFRSWFSRSRHQKTPTSESPVKLESVSTAEPAIAEGTPQRHGSSKKGFRALFRRDSTHGKEEHSDLQTGMQNNSCENEDGDQMRNTGSSGREELSAPETPTTSKFWRHWHPHRHRQPAEKATLVGPEENPGLETLRLPNEEVADMISHEEKRQKNMARLADQLEALSSESSPEHDVDNLKNAATPDRRLSNDQSLESGSTSSSIERAQALKERVGLVFSASPEDSPDRKADEISPLTPPGDAVENPYNYVFEPAKQKLFAPVAQDSTMIDNASTALENFQRALGLMTKNTNALQYANGCSSITLSEVSSQMLNFIKHEVQCQEHLEEENQALVNDLCSTRAELTGLKDESKEKASQYKSLQVRLEEAKANLELKKEELRGLKGVCHEKELENEKLHKSLSDATEALQSIKNELDDVQTQCQKKTEHQVQLQNDLKASNDKIDTMDKDLEEATEEIDMLSEEIESYKRKLQEAKTSERMAIERAEKDVAQARKDLEAEINSRNIIVSENNSLKSKVEDLQKELKNLHFDHEMLQEKHNITTTRLADLAGTISKEHGNEREMRDSIEVASNKMRRYENTIEILKIGNLKIQENFHRERRKVLDLRQENNLYQRQLQYIECHRCQSLQFMSHLMFYYRNIVNEETLAQFDYYLKKLNESDFCSNIVQMKDDELKECFKEREALVVKFYNDIAKQMFLDQVASEHVSYMRSNNFLSSQLSGLRKQVEEKEQYVKRLLKDIQTQKTSLAKSKQKVCQLKELNAKYQSKLTDLATKSAPGVN